MRCCYWLWWIYCVCFSFCFVVWYLWVVYSLLGCLRLLDLDLVFEFCMFHWILWFCVWCCLVTSLRFILCLLWFACCFALHLLRLLFCYIVVFVFAWFVALLLGVGGSVWLVWFIYAWFLRTDCLGFILIWVVFTWSWVCFGFVLLSCLVLCCCITCRC